MHFVETHAVHAMLSLSTPLPSLSLPPPSLPPPPPLSVPPYPPSLPTRDASESTILTSTTAQHSPLPTVEEPLVKPPPKMSLHTLLRPDSPPLPPITHLASTLASTHPPARAVQPPPLRPKTPILKRPYKKYYSNPTPSSHCHVCARTSKAVQFAICARIHQGLCRKVTCYKCFIKFGWDWHTAINDPHWVCVHCRGECPEGRSQCFIYARVNSRRGSKRKRNVQQQQQQQRQQVHQPYEQADALHRPTHGVQHNAAASGAGGATTVDGRVVSASQPYVSGVLWV